MAFNRARFLSSDFITVQGKSAVSVWKNIASLARVYSSPFVERRHIDWRELPLLEQMPFF